MALFSQCFAMRAVVAPVIGGRLLDQQGHGLVLWTLMAFICLAGVPMIRQLKQLPQIDDQGRSNNLSMLKQGVQAVSCSSTEPSKPNNR